MTEPWGHITEEDLHAYVDGALDGTRRLTVALYLARAPAQAARVEAFRAQKEGIHALFGNVVAEPPPKRLRWIALRRLSACTLRRGVPIVLAISIAGLLLLAASTLGQHLALLHGVLTSAAAHRPAASDEHSVIRPPSAPPVVRVGPKI